MAQVRRDPFGELWGEVNRVQDEFQRLMGRLGGPARWARPAFPAVNLWEDEGHVYAEADLPGFALEKLEVLVTEGDQLTLQGERTPPEVPNASWHRQERGYGQFARTITLPALVDAERVEARLENGVLKVVLPKSEAAKPKRIVVKTD